MSTNTADAAIKELITNFYACLKNNDPETMHSLTLPQAGATLIRKGEPLYFDMAGSINRVQWNTVEYDEVIDTMAVRVDKNGDAGNAWVQWTLYMNGKLFSKGCSAIPVWKNKDGRWLVAGLFDVSRPIED